ncbi:endonuclease/exonuclease/phosphatase family protein [Mariniblastus fucicola]|uniref:Exonuclease III n=1 Tax=Mariniblastus fucicola TaxID=980251 RepID=A0A5B9PHK6_9BACT|nr:endonuclease/exonuclease/phosphatase family protein [Mariniblastus fucicola]QEG22361.1 exonuclease III [Mariniblastus fucicola]
MTSIASCKQVHGRVVILLAFVFSSIVLIGTATAQEPLRVLSFNLRYGLANDGDNSWDNRKDHVVTTIENYQPDVVGTQETLEFQAAHIGDKLTEFTYAGRSRQKDGKGEHCGIFFRTSRFDKLIEGHFWLSENPDQPGSKSWDSSLPRMATWLKLWDRTNQHAFYLINTHFDHRGANARAESAKLIRRFVESLPSGSNVIITGDFNAGVNSGPYTALFAEDATASPATPSPVVDTFAAMNPDAKDNVGTFNAFKGTDSGARIDWIAASRKIEILNASIDRTAFDGKFPSDHFPVTAELRLPKLE